MNMFDGSMEDKCVKCGEPLLIFKEDVLHRNENGVVCTVCAKNEQCSLYSVNHVIQIKPDSEVNCKDCDAKITNMGDMVIYNQEKTPFVLCVDCDYKRQL